MSLHETSQTFFQIRPKMSGENRWYDVDSRCMFMSEAFSLNDLYHVSPVEMLGPQYYVFKVTLVLCSETKVLDFEFPQKSTALKAQRELCRAWTKTGEFEYVEEEITPVSEEVATSQPLRKRSTPSVDGEEHS